MKEFSNFLNTSLDNDNYTVYPLAGDASTRSYFRVVQNQKSYILMNWKPFNPETYPFLTVINLFKKHGVNVPKINSQSGRDGLLLLEDLGDLTLERKFWEFNDQALVIPYYEKAIDELIKIQFKCSSDQDKTCIAFNTKFDHDKFLWEFNYTYKHLLKGILKIKLSDSDDKKLIDMFSHVSAKLANYSTHIAHRDYHSRNLMIKLGKVVVIDFQDARLGPLQYDLVSLLNDSYVDLKPNNQKLLLNYYKASAEEFLPNSFSNDEFDNIFKLQKIQRCFKACGSFASFYNTRNDKRYLKYLNSTLKTVFNELVDNNELSQLLKLLNTSGALEFGYNKL